MKNFTPEKILALQLTVLTLALTLNFGFAGGNFSLDSMIILVSYPLQVAGSAMFSAAVYRLLSSIAWPVGSKSYRYNTYVLSAMIFHVSLAFTAVSGMGSSFINAVISVATVTLVMHGAGMLLFKNKEEKEEEEV